MKNLWKILRYAVPYWGFASLNILFNILAVLFSLGSFALFIPVLDMLFQKTSIPTTVHPLEMSFESVKENFYFFFGKIIHEHGEKTMLIYISISLVLLYLLKNLFRYLAMYFLANVRNGVVRDLRNDLYHKVLILPLSFYTEQRKGDLIARMTNDVQEIEWSIMSSLEMLFRDPINILTFVITLFVISPQLTLFVMVLLPVSGYLIGLIGKSLKRSSQKGQKRMGVILSIIEETISGLRIIKAFNAISFADNRFRQTNDDYTRVMIRLYRKRDLASPLSEFIVAVVVAIVLWFGGQLVLTHDSSLRPSDFNMYIGIFSQLLPPAKSITQAFYNVQKGAASVERIEQILVEPEVIEEKPDAIEKIKFDKEIEYRNVCFRYAAEPVLKNINLKITKGKTFAVVGPSGGGKSTLVDLLPRFYDCTEAEIMIDVVPIRDLKIDGL
ncbi:MAG: ABC transporter ATP-binding protein, partial [Bacteroidota bacterium]